MVFEFLYTSVLEPTADVRCVAEIMRRARSYNRLNGLTGILVFDGLRFCQYLEGGREAVLVLAGKIAADPRHLQFSILHQGFIGTERRFDNWSMAYALDPHGTVLEALAAAAGPKASTLLQQFVPRLVVLPSWP